MPGLGSSIVGLARRPYWKCLWSVVANNVVMLFPERSAHHLTYLAMFLRNFAQLYCSQKHNLVPSEWALGLLFNVHRCPMDKYGPWH